MRFVGALPVASAVVAIGALVLNALEIEISGLVWLALLLVAMIAASVVDRERFYGPPGLPRPHA